MSRRVTVSAFIVAGLFATVALGQPPADPKKPLGDKVKSAADPADAAVAKALANDPDVQVARAKVQLAEAELAKAKQAVVLKVMTLNATIQEQKVALTVAEQRYALIQQRNQAGTTSQTEVLEARAKYETAKAALSRTETELKLLTGGGGKEPGGELPLGNAVTVSQVLESLMLSQQEETRREAARVLSQWVGQKNAVQGPIPDRIREALDKKVKLGTKGETVNLHKAMEIFKKEAGLDVPMRGPGDIIQTPEIISQGEELPVGAWFQLYQDYNGCVVYVREYGILVANKQTAPPDAPTLTEFWKQKLPTKKEADPKDPEAMLGVLKYKQAELSTKYGPDHPEMVAIRRQIEHLEKELKDGGGQPKK